MRDYRPLIRTCGACGLRHALTVSCERHVDNMQKDNIVTAIVLFALVVGVVAIGVILDG